MGMLLLKYFSARVDGVSRSSHYYCVLLQMREAPPIRHTQNKHLSG